MTSLLSDEQCVVEDSGKCIEKHKQIKQIFRLVWVEWPLRTKQKSRWLNDKKDICGLNEFHFEVYMRINKEMVFTYHFSCWTRHALAVLANSVDPDQLACPDLHGLSLNMWLSIKNLDQVIWLAGNQKWAWHLNLFSIKKTCLCNFDPLKPLFYIVKLGFTGVHIIFIIFARNIDCVYSLEPPRRGGSNEYPQSMF